MQISHVRIQPFRQKKAKHIVIEQRIAGTITSDEDWLQYCREIFKVLNDTQQHYDEIRLLYSMPVSLAIAVGIAAQNYWNIMLTNYDSATNTYRDLIKLNQIRYRKLA